jgi:hypothetical protein
MDLANYLFSLLITCVIAAIVSWGLFLARLRSRHVSFYQALGQPTLSDGNFHSTIAVWMFLLSLRFLSLRDAVLTAQSITSLLLATTIAFLPIGILIVILGSH